MLNAIIKYSLKYRTPVLAVSMIMLIYGSYLATTLPIDVFPDLDRPRVVILTECPGLATEEVEALVTQPIEIALLGGNGVEAVRSQSTAGLNVIYVEFGWNVDPLTARQNVQERLLSISNQLPEGIIPQMTPQSSIMGQVVIAGLYRITGPSGGKLSIVENTNWVAEILPVINQNKQSENESSKRLKVWNVTDRNSPADWEQIEVSDVSISQTLPIDNQDVQFKSGERTYKVVFQNQGKLNRELGTIGEWVVRPRLLKVSGVAEVFLQGGDRKQYQVLVNPDALLEYGVTLQDVENALKSSNLNTSGGFAITGEAERPIRIFGRVGPGSEYVVEELQQVPVKTNSKRTILLSEVANIEEGAQFRRGDAAVDGRPAAVLSVVKQPHVDTRELTQRITDVLNEVEATLPADIAINPGAISAAEIYRPRRFQCCRGISHRCSACHHHTVFIPVEFQNDLYYFDSNSTIVGDDHDCFPIGRLSDGH